MVSTHFVTIPLAQKVNQWKCRFWSNHCRIYKNGGLVYKILILIFLFANTSLQTGHAQSDFRNGYIILQNNDSVFGLIDFRNDLRSSKLCVFKESENSEPHNYMPYDIRGYRFLEGKYYVSKKVKTKIEDKTVFVEFLVNGIVDLFYFCDQEGDHYLIETKDEELYELTNEQKRLNVGYSGVLQRNTNRYIGLLKVAFADCQEVQNQIENVSFSHNSLINITKDYHKYVCKDEECIVYEKQAHTVRFNFAPIVGMQFSNLKFERTAPHKYIDFEQSNYPIFGFSVNVMFPKVNEKSSFELATLYSKPSFHGFDSQSPYGLTREYIIDIESQLIQTSVAFKYRFTTGKVRPSLAIGGTLYKFFNPELRMVRLVRNNSGIISYELNEVPLSLFLMGGFFQIGCDYLISDKHILFSNFQYHYVSGMNWKTQTIIQCLSISIGYYF